MNRFDRRASTEAGLAVGLGLVSAGLSVATLSVATRTGLSLREVVNGPAQRAALAAGFSVLGVVILAHRRRHRIGWLCCAIGLAQAVAGVTHQYASYALASDPGGRAGVVVSWLAAWTWVPAIGLLLTFLVLLFPDGRLPSRRWRPVAWTAAASLAALVVLFAARAWPLRGPSLLTPLSLLGFAGRPGMVAGLVLLASVAASAVSLLVRLRRAGGVERQQLKWFAYAAAVSTVAVMLPAGVPVGVALLELLAVLCLPGAIAVAILRYRLYDIDRILNRTLVFGLLTAVLGLGYVGLVLVLGQLFGGMAKRPPSWAVAAATLAVAALFQPARHRIQDAVDRRFNRRRFDAARTIQAFSARLRQETDLDTLTAELLAVVDQTMEPTRASLWLRPSRSSYQEQSTTSASHAAW
jgi:hypothetical protein